MSLRGGRTKWEQRRVGNATTKVEPVPPSSLCLATEFIDLDHGEIRSGQQLSKTTTRSNKARRPDGGSARVEQTHQSNDVGEGRGRRVQCGDNAVSGPAETDSSKAATEVVGGGWLGRWVQRRGRERRRGGVSRGG